MSSIIFFLVVAIALGMIGLRVLPQSKYQFPRRADGAKRPNPLREFLIGLAIAVGILALLAIIAVVWFLIVLSGFHQY